VVDSVVFHEELKQGVNVQERQPLIPQVVENGDNFVELAEQDARNTIRALRKAKARRTAPPWCCKREIWLLILCRPYHLKEAEQFPCLCSLQILPQQIFQQLCRAIRRVQQAVSGWYCSLVATLDKQNGVMGPGAFRSIHMLDPLGKAFFSGIFKKYPQTTWQFQHGFTKNRRREAAILIQDCQRQRLRRAGRSHNSKLHDVQNAFPSPEHEVLDGAIWAKNPCQSDAELMRQRFRTSYGYIKCLAGRRLLYKTGSGAAQEMVLHRSCSVMSTILLYRGIWTEP